jgi:hypothetical protein
MARLISRLDPAVLGLRIAAGDRALDDLADESAGSPLPQSACRGTRTNRYAAIEANIAVCILSVGTGSRAARRPYLPPGIADALFSV